MALSSQFFGLATRAQTFSGALVGPIDAQHAVMAGASVTLYSVDRGFERQTKTNREGEYAIELVPPGKFTLRAEAAGFAFLETVGGGDLRWPYFQDTSG